MTKHLKIILIILLCILNTSVVFSGSLKGKVIDADTGEPLLYATVAVKGTGLGTMTDINGEYELIIKNTGTYTIIATYIGYSSAEEEIYIGENDIVKKDFLLHYGSYDLDEVIVTVQAKGQMKAINQQINSRSISNILSSERIQEVPDATAAEAVGRLPGVSVQAENGEGNKVIIRGMEPRFSIVTINGVRAPSLDQTDNSVGMAGISPFIVSGIEVQKSLTPDKDADVIGGIVDLKLKVADEGLHTNIIFQNNTNSLNKDSKFNPQLTFQGGNRFFDNKLGILLVGNYENVDRSSHRMSVTDLDLEGVSEEVINWHSAEWYHSILSRERFGGSVFIDYKLKNGNIRLNNFTNGLNTTSIERQDIIDSRGTNSYAKQNNISDENNLSIVNNLNLEHKLFWNSTLEVDVSYTSATKKAPRNYGFKQNFILAERDSSGLFPESLNYIVNDNNVDPYEFSKITPYLRDSSYYISELSASDELFKENELSFKLDWAVPYSFAENRIWGEFKAGGKYRSKNREFDRNSRGTDLTVGGAELMRAQIKELNPEIDFSGFRSYVFENLPTYNILDNNYSAAIHDQRFELKGFADEMYIRQIIDRLEEAKWSSVPSSISEFKDIPDDYSGNEQILAAYGMTELNFKSIIQFVGGARFEKLKTDYRSYGIKQTAANDGIIKEFGDKLAKKENAFLLPMFNLKITPAKWMNIRLAYTHSLARPRYYSQMPRYNLNIIGSLSNIGNPDLLPALSKNFDANISFRSNKLGLLTIGGFYKKIEGYESVKGYPILNDSSNVVHPYFGEPYNIVATNGNSLIYMPINSPYDSYTKGLEFDWQTVFWYLPGVLKGLVFNINYTMIKTEQTQTVVLIKKEYPDPTKPWLVDIISVDSAFTKPMFQQPDGVLNVSIGYDYKGFSARLAYNMRTITFVEVTGDPGLIESDVNESKYDQWDLSIRQKLPKGLQIFLNATNLGNSYRSQTRTMRTGGLFPMKEQFYGRAVIVGLRYNL